MLGLGFGLRRQKSQATTQHADAERGSRSCQDVVKVERGRSCPVDDASERADADAEEVAGAGDSGCASGARKHVGMEGGHDRSAAQRPIGAADVARNAAQTGERANGQKRNVYK